MNTRPRSSCPRLFSRCSVVAAACGLVAYAGGCASPLERDGDPSERALVEGLMRELREARQHDRERALEREPAELRLDPRFMDEIQSLGGVGSYEDDRDFGEDLLGNPQQTADISLDEAIASGVRHNLALQFARLEPAVAEAQVVRAEAVFDWVFFASADYNELESQQISSSQFQVTRDERNTAATSLGLRRNTGIGGTFSIQQDFQYTDILTPDTGSLQFSPDPAWESTLTVQATQPLLRGFGTDVAREALLLARNAERNQVANLKSQAINTVTQVETAYWQLVQAHYNLQILERNLARGRQTQREVRIRVGLDADPAEVADADATVQERFQTLLQARTALRDASDNLKVQMNDPRYPVGGEVLLVPVDMPVDQAVEYGLFDSYQTALRRRPEITQALLSLDDAAIRRRVADNGLLPRLDLTAQLAIGDLDSDIGTAFNDQFNFSRQSWLFGLDFELPIGNRDAEATRDERRLQQQQAAISYRQAVQDVISQVRTSLRQMDLNYRLIGSARTTRLAAAENLRVFIAQKETTAVNTPERLNLEFQRQNRLAASEQAEVAALVDYMIAIANLHAAMGTALERSGVTMIVPDAGEFQTPD